MKLLSIESILWAIIRQKSRRLHSLRITWGLQQHTTAKLSRRQQSFSKRQILLKRDPKHILAISGPLVVPLLFLIKFIHDDRQMIQRVSSNEEANLGSEIKSGTLLLLSLLMHMIQRESRRKESFLMKFLINYRNWKFSALNLFFRNCSLNSINSNNSYKHRSRVICKLNV